MITCRAHLDTLGHSLLLKTRSLIIPAIEGDIHSLWELGPGYSSACYIGWTWGRLESVPQPLIHQQRAARHWLGS